MDNHLSKALLLASEHLLAETYMQLEKAEEHFEYIELSSDQINLLGKKILAMPNDDIAMLLLHYALEMNCNDIASILKQDMIRGKLLYSEHVLSIGLGFSEATRVGRQSLSSACRNALVEYTKHDGVELPPHYSRSFMKVMRKIKAVHNRPKPIYRILQRAAIFLVVFGISFGIAISVNAELRESVFRWIVETFPQFSKFSLQADQSTEEPSYEELLLYKPTFIPDGYVEVPIDNFPPDVYYIYEDDEGNILAIIGCVPGSGPISLNTEGVSPEITTFRGEEAFYWNKDGITYLSLVIDGYQFSISGQISRDIIVNIAENIKRM